MIELQPLDISYIDCKWLQLQYKPVYDILLTDASVQIPSILIAVQKLKYWINKFRY